MPVHDLVILVTNKNRKKNLPKKKSVTVEGNKIYHQSQSINLNYVQGASILFLSGIVRLCLCLSVLTCFSPLLLTLLGLKLQKKANPKKKVTKTKIHLKQTDRRRETRNH